MLMDGYSTVSTDTYTTDATHNLVHATLASPDRCDDRVYTLGGQRVAGPQSQGVYIVNGKTIIR